MDQCQAKHRPISEQFNSSLFLNSPLQHGAIKPPRLPRCAFFPTPLLFSSFVAVEAFFDLLISWLCSVDASNANCRQHLQTCFTYHFEHFEPSSINTNHTIPYHRRRVCLTATRVPTPTERAKHLPIERSKSPLSASRCAGASHAGNLLHKIHACLYAVVSYSQIHMCCQTVVRYDSYRLANFASRDSSPTLREGFIRLGLLTKDRDTGSLGPRSWRKKPTDMEPSLDSFR
jgi:hypothetical protein